MSSDGKPLLQIFVFGEPDLSTWQDDAIEWVRDTCDTALVSEVLRLGSQPCNPATKIAVIVSDKWTQSEVDELVTSSALPSTVTFVLTPEGVADLAQPAKLSFWTLATFDAAEKECTTSSGTYDTFKALAKARGPGLLGNWKKGKRFDAYVRVLENAALNETIQLPLVQRLTWPFNPLAPSPVDAVTVKDESEHEPDVQAKRLDLARTNVPAGVQYVDPPSRKKGAAPAAVAASLKLCVWDLEGFANTEELGRSIEKLASNDFVIAILPAEVDKADADEESQQTTAAVPDFLWSLSANRHLMYTAVSIEELNNEQFWKMIWLTAINRFNLTGYVQSKSPASTEEVRKAQTHLASLLQASNINADDLLRGYLPPAAE